MEEANSYCAHPSVFDKTGYGQEIAIMRMAGGLCDKGKLFQLSGSTHVERRATTERRQVEDRRAPPPPPPWLKTNWKGLILVLGGLTTVITPIVDYFDKREARMYQFQLDIKKMEVQALKEQALERLGQPR
jgi:hypothetical protein